MCGGILEPTTTPFPAVDLSFLIIETQLNTGIIQTAKKEFHDFLQALAAAAGNAGLSFSPALSSEPPS